VAIPLWLRREERGRVWEEETETHLLSRYGAGVACRHSVEPGSTLAIVRRDTGGRATARVIYSRYDAREARREIGVEILQAENFWELDWTPAAPEPEPAEVAAMREPEPAAATETLAAERPDAVASATEPRGAKRREKFAREGLANFLIAQEQKLWEALRTKDAAAFRALVAADVVWVSPAGVSRAALELPPAIQPHWAESQPEEFGVTQLNKSTAMVTFRAAPAGAGAPAAHHTSLWMNRGGRWQVALHQHTLAD